MSHLSNVTIDKLEYALINMERFSTLPNRLRHAKILDKIPYHYFLFVWVLIFVSDLVPSPLPHFKKKIKQMKTINHCKNDIIVYIKRIILCKKFLLIALLWGSFKSRILIKLRKR